MNQTYLSPVGDIFIYVQGSIWFSSYLLWEVFSIYGLRNFGFKNHCKSFYFGTPKIFITVTIFGVTIFGVTIFDVTIFEITKEIPLKFKLGFLCVLSRPSVTKHCDLLFLVFLVPPVLEFSKNLEFSQIFWVPQIFFDFFSNGIFSDFFGTPRFF